MLETLYNTTVTALILWTILVRPIFKYVHKIKPKNGITKIS